MKYAYASDLTRLHIRIGIEKPIADFARSFFIPGQARCNFPRVTVEEAWKSLSAPHLLHQDERLPLLHVRRGIVHMGSVNWGVPTDRGASTKYYQGVERRTLGFPAMCPASFVDIALHVQGENGGGKVLRLRPASSFDHFYIGFTYKSDRLAQAETASMLVCEAGPDIKRYVEWQPLLIPVRNYPDQANFDFVLGRDKGRLQVPPVANTIKADILSL